MNNWEQALNKFINQYKNEDYFVGALLTGSYLTGNNNQNSDIDVYIITNNEITWRERGNKLIDGYMIEYFINPISKIKSYFTKELESYHLSTTMMFVNSKIIYDKTNEVQALVDIAKDNIKNLNNLKEIDDFKYKSNCYSVWDSYDELESKYKEKEDIDFTYYLFLQKVIDGYFYNKQIPSLPLNKIEKILKNEDYKNKYNILKLPEKTFNELFLKCLSEKEYDKKFANAKELYNYFMNEFKDFDINNYALRSSAQ